MNNLEILNNIIGKKGIINFFTIKDGISPKLLSQLTHIGLPHYNWVNRPEDADYFVLPCNYEVGHDSDFYNKHATDYNARDIPNIHAHETSIIALAKQFNKKVIIIYFSDSAREIPVEHAIIFRTSIEKSKSSPYEHAMPVIKVNLFNEAHHYNDFLAWKERPSVGFRGIATPLKFNKFTRTIRNKTNLLANRFGMSDVFNLRKNYGYLERRNALEVLQRNKTIHCDFSITEEKDSNDETARKLYIDNVFNHPYILCAAGFGNYSYRFYETLSAGRIPVFIDTDCKLPFEEFINWKEHVVWVDRKDIYRVDKILLEFHEQRKHDFIQLQQNNKYLWQEFLSPQAYFKKIIVYL